MPVPPAQPVGAPFRNTESVNFPATAAGTNATSDDLVSDHAGFLTAAKLIPQAALAANGTNFRTYALVDTGAIKSITDGAIAAASAVQGDWFTGATTATTGQVWYYGNQAFLCISAVTNGTVPPPADNVHWLPLAGLGLNVLNSVQYPFSLLDVGKAIADSGNTHVPAGAVITGVVQMANASAAILSNAGSAAFGDAVTIGSARTLATLSTAATPLAAGVETDMVLSTTDTAIYVSDVLTLVSGNAGTGAADPGGALQLEVTSFGQPSI